MLAALRRVGLGVAVAAALATSACAAGQQASTANERPTIDGVDGTVGAINLRGLNIEAPSAGSVSYPVGSDVAVKLVIVNNGQQPDQLKSITSAAFSGWHAYASTDQAEAVIAESSPSATTTPTTTPTGSVKIAPGTRKSWGTPEAKGALLLLGTTRVLHPGTAVRITFTFAQAGSVTLAVPIALSGSPNTSPIPEPSESSSFEG